MSGAEDIKPDLPYSWVSLSAAFLALGGATVIAGYLIVNFVLSRPYDLYEVSEQRGAELMSILTANQVPRDMIERFDKRPMEDRKARWYSRRYDAVVPATVSLDGLKQVISRNMNPYVFVEELLENGESVGLKLAIGEWVFAELHLETVASREAPAPKTIPAMPTAATLPDVAQSESEAFEPPQDASQSAALDAEPWKVANEGTAAALMIDSGALPVDAPRLAIIVDDGGYSQSIIDAILAMDPGLTLAILPYTPHGEATAKRAADLGFEIMLHMPMDNLDKTMVYEGQLKTGMGEDEMLKLTEAALAQVPGAVGVNNHEGSRFTADGKSMALFIDIIKDRDLFFVDSRTVVDTRAYDMAVTFGVPAAERDLFLDHDNEVEMIRRRFGEVLAIARAQGQAIAICHFRRNTVTVLQEMLPQLGEQGIRLVHASELIP
jgi:hypothetical protein